MSKRINKRTREQAAMLCQLMASNPEPGGWFIPACAALDVNCYADDAAIVARLAYWNRVVHHFTASQDWAEAEALLRTGWSP